VGSVGRVLLALLGNGLVAEAIVMPLIKDHPIIFALLFPFIVVCALSYIAGFLLVLAVVAPSMLILAAIYKWVETTKWAKQWAQQREQQKQYWKQHRDLLRTPTSSGSLRKG
jgi:hypothetical protein